MSNLSSNSGLYTLSVFSGGGISASLGLRFVCFLRVVTWAAKPFIPYLQAGTSIYLRYIISEADTLQSLPLLNPRDIIPHNHTPRKPSIPDHSDLPADSLHPIHPSRHRGGTNRSPFPVGEFSTQAAKPLGNDAVVAPVHENYHRHGTHGISERFIRMT